MSIATTGLRIKVTLKGVEPLVMRSIAVPLTMRLDRLHLTLQAAFGWSNSHLYMFQAAGAAWSPDPDSSANVGDVRKTRLYDIVRDTGARTIHYLYDFGDGWDHLIKIEKWVENGGPYGLPMLLNCVGRCPPEDVGGPSGYAELLEELRKLPPSKRPFDPSVLDRRDLDRAMTALEKKWELRRPRA